MNIDKVFLLALIILLSLSGCAVFDSHEQGVQPVGLSSQAGSIGSGKQLPLMDEGASLADLDDILSTDGISDNVAVSSARDTFNELHDHRAWIALVDYFTDRGRTKAALEQLTLHSDPGFAIAIVSSEKFSLADKRKAVEVTGCDRNVQAVFFTAYNNLPPSITKRLAKACDRAMQNM